MISAILYGRNDAHGYNLHRRAALSLNCIAEVLTDLDDEIVFVDYNTPDELPTFIEAISDTLTDRCLGLLRVVRVPASIHEQRFATRTHLPVVEPVARNVAVRRTNQSNRWLLSTNTDMIILPLVDQSLSEICNGLSDGFYGLPRFELPEWIWERLPRSEPRTTLAEMKRLGPGLRLDEPTMSHEWIRFDAPGDFQLVLRDDFEAIDGFDEEMLLGYHVDSNLSRRLLLRRGSIQSLEDHVAGYHCNHNRTRTVYHGTQLENDIVSFFFSIDKPELHAQRGTWGLVDVALEEVAIRERVTTHWAASVLAGVPTGPRTPSDAFGAPFALTYDSGHVLPFVADSLIISPTDVTIGYLGANPFLERMLAVLVERLGLRRPLVVASFDDSASVDEFALIAEVFIVDLGIDVSQVDAQFNRSDLPPFPHILDRAFAALDRLIGIERERFAQIGHPRRFVLVNSSTAFWDAYVMAQFDCSYTTTHSRVRRATVKRVRDDVAVRTALSHAQRLMRWSVRHELAEDLLVHIGEIIEFADLDDYRGFGEGWAHPQDEGIWTEGPRSKLRLFLDGATNKRDFAITFVIGMICVGPGESLRVELHVNGEHVTAQEFTQNSAGVPWRIELPSCSFIRGKADLTLLIDEPRSPAAVGWSPDDRQLGVLIRTLALNELDRSVTLGEEIVFSEGSGAERLLGDGWSWLEPTGVWTVGDRARLVLELLDISADLDGATNKRDFAITFVIGMICVGPGESLRVELHVNGEHVTAQEFTQNSAGVPWRIELPSCSFIRGKADLTLLIDEPRSPAAVGWSPDDRQLGVLIRTLALNELDRSVTLGEEIVFSEGSGAERLLGDGWSWLEPTGVWTVGDRARLVLELLDMSADMELVLNVLPFVTPDHPVLEVQVSAGRERLVAQIFRHGEVNQSVHVPLPAAVINEEGRAILDLHLSEPARPIDLGISSDARRLGLHLRSLTVGRTGTGADAPRKL